MKFLVKPLLFALSLGLFASTVEAKPTRPTTVATFQTGMYTTIDGKLHIALDKQKGGAIDIRLTNQEGMVVYSQHVGKNKSQYRAKFDLSNLPDGTYKVDVSNGQETTTYALSLATPAQVTPSRVITVQ